MRTAATLVVALVAGCHLYRQPPDDCARHPKEPSATRRHWQRHDDHLATAMVIVNIQSADSPTGYLTDAVITAYPPRNDREFHATPIETSGIYQMRLVPGTYRFLVRRVGYEFMTDTIVLDRGTVDSAVYRLLEGYRCINDLVR